MKERTNFPVRPNYDDALRQLKEAQLRRLIISLTQPSLEDSIDLTKYTQKYTN